VAPLILRAADRSAVPWKNGGGLTREVAIHPSGSGLERFDWRVSIAEVRTGGPFSVFTGIERSLAVLEGALSLAIAGRDELTLSSETPPVRFSGEVAVSGRPLGGPVTDLNVMTRRGRCEARMNLMRAPLTVPRAKGTTLLIALTPLGLAIGARRYELTRLDAAQFEALGGCEVQSAPAMTQGAFWLIELGRAVS
jgi:uncharacterized protein